MTKKLLYRGFSTANYMANGTLRLSGVDVIKADLYNAIYTPKGSRRMMAKHGSIIPNVPFEAITPAIVEGIHNDLDDIFKRDPRVRVITLQVVPYPDDNTIIASANLLFVEFGTVEKLQYNFNVGNTQ